MFHLAWFTNPRTHGWTANGPDRWAGNDILPESWETGSFLVDMVKQLERMRFDFIMIEDHVVLSNDKQNLEPRLDPLPVVTLLAANTHHLGVVATLSSSFYPPFLLARQIASVDHISRGRAGWNVVTSSEDWAAQAFGMDKQPPHDERYARADEMLTIFKEQWDAWQPDAYEMNAETGRYVDPSKFREFEFNGKYYKSRGPLNVSRSPQGRPVICQAGSSPAGKAFAAKHSDVVLFSNFGEFNLQGMIDFRNDIKRLAKEAGRNPDDVKVMYLISPVVGDTERAAQERYTEIVTMTPAVLKRRLGLLTLHTNYDWTQFDLDKPLPPIDPAQFTEGFQGLVGNIVRMASKKTLREALSEQETTSLKLIGTPEQVADMMEDAMEKLGGDGFLMHARPLTRRYLAEILDGLVPILQKRGLVRTEYSGKTFRENMQAF